MAKWITLYHPSRRIVTTSLDDDTERLANFKRVGWKIGALPPEALPDSLDELEIMAEAGDLLAVEVAKKPASKKAKKE
ncbi:unnamed protein product [marine sediment metagenome]|uniref:Uncharacterized protein n=1 Tax=marine sediment metagenome TaxID=412755 RepID=X0VTJ1_9ZZZZ